MVATLWMTLRQGHQQSHGNVGTASIKFKVQYTCADVYNCSTATQQLQIDRLVFPRLSLLVIEPSLQPDFVITQATSSIRQEHATAQPTI